MSERLKRILFVASIAVFTIAIGIGVYYVFFRPEITPEEAIPEEGVPGAFPESGEAGERPGVGELLPGELEAAPGVPGAVAPGVAAREPQTVLLRDGITQETSPSADGMGARYYNPEDSKFYRINTDGLSTALSDREFPNVEDVSWGKASDQAILEFPDGSKIHYDFDTEKQTTLPKHWNDFDFSTDDGNVVAKSEAIAPESRFLIISNPDGKSPRAIESLGENERKTFPAWTPNEQIVAYATVGESRGFDRQEIILIGKNRENFQGLLVEGRGFQPLWSPSGQLIVYSVWNLRTDYRPELWISGGAPGNMNENRRQLNIQTWANKCAWHTDKVIYCAVPEELPVGAGMQPELYADITDRITKIDLETGVVSDLGKPEGELSVRDPVVTDDGQFFIFTDTTTGLMYKFRLQ